jgi:c-di-GMP-binding flagellar brake protein YcgR
MPLSNTSPSTGNSSTGSMGYDITVLVDSKAVVEKKGFVSTGTLTYVAGELLEIEFPQYDQFMLGEKVKVMIYAKGGIYVFESTVLAKDQGALVVLNPPENRRKFQDKRQDPRVPVREQARVLSLYEHARKVERKFPDPPTVLLDNISMSGIGLLFNIDLPLQTRNQLHLELDLGNRFECRTEIVHLQRTEEGTRCGTRIIELKDDHANWLRSYILRSQIEAYYREKAEKLHKEMVGEEGEAEFDAQADQPETVNTDRTPQTYLFNDSKYEG